MSRGLASLIGVLGGAGAFMSGYAKGKDQVAEAERKKALDAQQQEEYDYQKGLRDKASKLQDDLAASQADLSVDPVMPAADPNAYNPGDMAGMGSSADLSGPGGTAVAPAPAPQPTGYKVGNQTYANQGQAQMALRGVNSRAAKNARAAQVYRDAGQLDKAQQYDTFAQQALDEGTDKILASIQSQAPTLADLKKAGGTVRGTVGQQAANVFNQTGGRWNVAPDMVVEHYIDKTPAGREFVNSRVLGADGKPVVDDVHHAGLMLQDYKTRMESDNADTNAALVAQRQSAEDADRKAQLLISRGQLGVMQARERREAAAQDAATPAGKISAVEAALHAPLPIDQKMSMLGVSRLSQPDQLVVNSLLKQQEQMDQAKNKALADGSWAPDSAGAKEMATQAAMISLKLNKVLAKYGNAPTAAGADPLNILGTGARPSPAASGVNPVPRPPARTPPAPQARGADDVTILGRQIDVRNDPTIAALNEGAARLAGKTDPQSVQQMMALGTARNARLEQLQQQYGSAAQLIAQ